MAEVNEVERPTLNILSLDGGGSRGVMEAAILDDIMNVVTLLKQEPEKLISPISLMEKVESRKDLRNLLGQVKVPVQPAEIFDMIVGTSTGALIAFALVGGKEDGYHRRTPMSIKELMDYYKKLTPKIFEKSGYFYGFANWASQGLGLPPVVPYTQNGLEEELKTMYGKTTLMQFQKGCIAGAVAKEHYASGFSGKLELFDTESEICHSVVSVLKATADAPVYFQTPTNVGAKQYVDGGIGGNCPLAQALPRIMKLKGKGKDNHINVISLAPPRAKAVPIPTRRQISYWINWFPTQFTDGYAVYLDVKDHYPEFIFQRFCPRSEDAVKYQMDELDVDAMVDTIKNDESINDKNYFLSIMKMAMIIASKLQIDDKERFLELLIEVLMVCKESNEESHFEDGLLVGKIMSRIIDNNFQSLDVAKNVAKGHFIIGECHFGLYQYQNALEEHQTSFEMKTTLLMDLTDSLTCIGLCFEKLEKFEKALEKYQECLKLIVDFAEESSVTEKIASTKLNIGNCYFKMDRFQKAKECYTRSLELMEQLGSAAPKTDRCQFSIGNCFYQLGEFDKAKEHYEKSIEICKGFEDGDKRKVRGITDGLDGIALCLLETENNTKEALEMNKNSLAIKRDAYEMDAENPDIAKSLNNIGVCYYKMENYHEALKFYEKSKLMKRHVFGDYSGSSQITDSLNNIGLCFMDLEDTEKAMKTFNECVERIEEVNGKDTKTMALSDVLTNRGKCCEQEQEKGGNLIDSLKKQGKNMRDPKSFNEGVARIEEVFGKDVQTLVFKDGKCYKYEHESKYTQALKDHERSYDIRKGIYKDRFHTRITDSLDNLGIIHRKLIAPSKAFDLHSESLEMKKSQAGDSLDNTEARGIAYTEQQIGFCYEKMKDYTEAIKHHSISLELLKKHSDNSVTSKRMIYESLTNIGLCYDDLEQYETSLKYHEESLKKKQDCVDAGVVEPHRIQNTIKDSFDSIIHCSQELGRNQNVKQFESQKVSYLGRLAEMK